MLAPLLAVITSKSKLLSDEFSVHSRDDPDCLNFFKMYYKILGSEQFLENASCCRLLQTTSYNNSYMNCNFGDKIYCYQIQLSTKTFQRVEELSHSK